MWVAATLIGEDHHTPRSEIAVALVERSLVGGGKQVEDSGQVRGKLDRAFLNVCCAIVSRAGIIGVSSNDQNVAGIIGSRSVAGHPDGGEKERVRRGGQVV